MEKDKSNKVEEKKANPKSKKTILTLFLFLLPSLMMAYTSDPIMKIGLFFYLAVILKNFIEDHYNKEYI